MTFSEYDVVKAQYTVTEQYKEIQKELDVYKDFLND